MTNNNEINKPETPATAPITTPEPTTTPAAKCRVFGSMQKGVDTSAIHFKSVLELRREFCENWV